MEIIMQTSNNKTNTNTDLKQYIGLMQDARQYFHYPQTYDLYWKTYRETKSHSEALEIGYQDLYFDTDFPN